MVKTIIVTEDTDLEVTTPTLYKFEFPNSISKTTIMKVLQEGSYTLREEGIVFNKADIVTTSWKLKFKCLCLGIIFLGLSFCLSSCSADPKVGSKYDHLIVMDETGEKYLLSHNVGNTYFIYKPRTKLEETN